MLLSVAAGLMWDAGTNANVLVALATLALAGVAVWTAKTAADTADQARRAAAAAELAVAAAQAQIAEAARGRVDASGPSVALTVTAGRNANLLISRGPLPQNGGHFLMSSTGIHSSEDCVVGREFTFPRDANMFLWFRSSCTLHNEGPASVRVSTTGYETVPTMKGEGLGDPSYSMTQVVRPGEAFSFAWADGHTLGEWANGRDDHGASPNPLRSLRLTVQISDLRGTVVDYIFVEVSGTPLDLAPQAEGVWRVVSTSLSGTVYPVRRWYRHEGLPYPTDPWNEALLAARAKQTI